MFKQKYISPGVLDVQQGPIHGKHVSYNPDDDRFYVTHGEHETKATFANNTRGWSNMIQYCRTHQSK